jgi:hypothetical protein
VYDCRPEQISYFSTQAAIFLRRKVAEKFSLRTQQHCLYSSHCIPVKMAVSTEDPRVPAIRDFLKENLTKTLVNGDTW